MIAQYLYGPFTRLGLVAAVIACAVDQAAKLWLFHGVDLANKGIVKLMPFIDLVLTWNTGISYGLFQQDSAAGLEPDDDQLLRGRSGHQADPGFGYRHVSRRLPAALSAIHRRRAPSEVHIAGHGHRCRTRIRAW